MATAIRAPQLLARAKAWDSLGNGALFTTRICRASISAGRDGANAQDIRRTSAPFQGEAGAQRRCLSTSRPPNTRPTGVGLTTAGIQQQLAGARRVLQTSSPAKQEAGALAKENSGKAYRDEVSKLEDPADEDLDEDHQSFKRSERAAQASQLNLSARLSSEGKTQGGLGEVWRLVKIASPEVKTLSIAFAFLLVGSSVTALLPFSIGKIMDAASQETGGILGFSQNQFFIGLGSILAVGACANYGRILLLRITGERIVTKLRSSLYRKTFIQNAEFFDANRVGDLISRLGSDTIIVGKSITVNMSDGLRSLVSATAGLTMMAWTSVKLTGVLAIFLPPVALGAFFYGRAIRNLSRRQQKNLGTLTKIAEERLGNVRTSQSFAGELQEVHRYNSQTRKIFGLGRKEAFLASAFFSASGFMGNMTFLALLYVGGGMVRSGAITVGDMTSFLMYAGFAGSSLFGLSSFYSELMKGVGAASRLFELQDRNPTISPTSGDAIRSARGAIEFKDVSFAYPTRPAVNIFKNLNFRIEQGSNVAIVAPSGAGKSTVASLLLRFYIPTEGTITIAGKDITKINAKQLRRKIGYVGQEPVLFSGTIAENIAYGRPTATRGEITAAARRANCGFISDFPDGLETFAGARGTQLSGGQKQRIAIARALLKEPDILILDEATSALDAESETLVNQALSRMLSSNNTTISIAHRLSTIQRSDVIIVLGSDGTVAQTGSYRELSQDKDGAFAKLMEWQMSGGSAAALAAPEEPVPVPDVTKEDVDEEQRSVDDVDTEAVVRDGEGGKK
ncbi:ATP-binding cassette permease mdl1 [Saxophila tyrrhenica]|uniref:ATP-binding cassette permease mdl1 n=1 Tax=Saxophila tyrrhenica TaxID=1690608 RepID=A0AAV9PA84_9PEZI|nr:ATP-binding cassette permease mdl1 [Saxophila tyrrhenica]